MTEFIAENGGTIVVCIIILILIILAVRKLWKDRKTGQSQCGCACDGCPHAGNCHDKAK